MVNKLCHFEIGCRDYARTKEFYSKLFDWKFEKTADGREMIRTGDEVGGHLNSLGHEPHHYVTFYIMVEDVAEALKQAEALGGKKIVGPVKEPHGGTFAWFSDPEGNVIGIYTEKQ
jgi:predicted enzyme related to lactoylglutathione lyase